MRRQVTTLVLVAVLAASAGVFAADAVTAGEKLAIESLIKQFGDRQFSTRQAAVAKLIDIGPKVVPLVQATLLETEDNEVKLRCRMVLDGIGKKYGIAVTKDGPAPGKFGLEASKVTIKLTNVELDEVLQVLAEQSGNKLVKQPENWEEKTISLNVTDMPYWQALDEVCKQAGLTYTGDFQSRSVKLVPVKDGADITGYTGPIVVKVANGTRRKDFRGMVTRVRFSATGLAYALNYFVEDRLKPLSMSATVTKAVAPDGAELALPVRQPMAWMGGMMAARTPWGTIYVTINAFPEDLQKIARFEGTVRMRFGSGKRVLKIKDVFGEGERKVEDDDTVVKVERVWRNRGYTTISLSQTEDGEQVTVPRYPSTSDYGYELIDPDGGRHKSGIGGGGGGVMWQNVQPRGGQLNRKRGAKKQAATQRVEIVLGEARVVADAVVVVMEEETKARGAAKEAAKGKEDAKKAAAAPAPGVVVGNVPRAVARARRGNSYVTFRNLPDIDGGWTLVCTIPLKTVEKTFDFTVKDVPLP